MLLYLLFVFVNAIRNRGSLNKHVLLSQLQNKRTTVNHAFIISDIVKIQNKIPLTERTERFPIKRCLTHRDNRANMLIISKMHPGYTYYKTRVVYV